jgi:hypothetical protein
VSFFSQLVPRQRDEQVRHRHQAHVMVPTHPRPRLVLRHPQVALGVLEEVLDLVPAARHPSQHLQRRRGVGVADIVLHLRHRVQRPSHQQPDRRPRLAVAHRPDPDRGELVGQRAFRPLTQIQHPPRLGPQPRGRRGHRRHRLPARLRRDPTPPAVGRHARGRVLGPDRRVDRYLDSIPQFEPFHLVEELAVLPITPRRR